jgi:hypothetical protein
MAQPADTHKTPDAEQQTKRRRIYEDNHVEWMRTVNTFAIVDDLRCPTLCIRAFNTIARNVDAVDMNMMTNDGSTVWMILMDSLVLHCETKRRWDDINGVVEALTRALPNAHSQWNIHTRDTRFRSSVHLAVLICLFSDMNTTAMRLLDVLIPLCDLDARDEDGDTPFTTVVAVANHRSMAVVFPLLQYLVSKGFDASAQDYTGCTILHVLAHRPESCLDIMTEIMRHELLNIDWTLKTHSDQTFLDVALSHPPSVPNAVRMQNMCNAWVTRCLNFTCVEVNEVIRVKDLADIVLEYIM